MFAGALVVVMVLAAYLRLTNLSLNPGWYTDEGTHLDIARNLLRGRWQYLAINQSTLLFAKLPLFEFLLAGVVRLTRLDMTALRGLTGVLGTLTVGVLVLVAWHISRDRLLAILAGLILAIYPPAVLYSRLGFSYNLLAPLLLLTLWGTFGYRSTGRSGWLALAAMAGGAGIVTDLWFVTLIPIFLWLLWQGDRRDGWWALILLALPFGLYATGMLLHSPQAFWFDLNYTLFRLQNLSWSAQITTLAQNVTILLLQDGWLALGLVGLWLLRPALFRWLSLSFFFLPVLILGRTVALYSLSAYYLIPLWPLAALGLASLIRHGLSWARQTLASSGRVMRWSAGLALGLLVFVPLVTIVWQTAGQVRNGYQTAIDPFLVDGAAVRSVASYVNNNRGDEELVIASPGVGWLINGQVADFQMAVAAAGKSTPHLPADIPPDRFAFDPRFERVRFVIVDNLWHNWAMFHVPGLSALIDEVEGWPEQFSSGQIRVYENPRTR